MPTRRFADKSAALMAIRELHKRKELDEHLRIVSKDLDSEDELGEAERAQTKHAGTGRRKQYYRNEVCLYYMYIPKMDIPLATVFGQSNGMFSLSISIVTTKIVS